MSAARVKEGKARTRQAAELYEKARADAIRDAEVLLALLRGRGSLKRLHYQAYDVHMSAGLLYTWSGHLAMMKARAARARAGRKGPSTFDAMGWPAGAVVYQKRKAGGAA